MLRIQHPLAKAVHQLTQLDGQGEKKKLHLPPPPDFAHLCRFHRGGGYPTAGEKWWCPEVNYQLQQSLQSLLMFWKTIMWTALTISSDTKSYTYRRNMTIVCIWRFLSKRSMKSNLFLSLCWTRRNSLQHQTSIISTRRKMNQGGHIKNETRKKKR